MMSFYRVLATGAVAGVAWVGFNTHSAAGAVPGADVLSGLITQQFDANSDGILDSGEWESGTQDGFGEMDGNGDAGVSDSEIDSLAEPIREQTGELGAAVAVLLIKQLLFTLDTNADKIISKAEYAAGCEAIFKKIDADSDGNVTKAELNDLPVRLLKSA